MKNILLLAVLVFSIQLSYGQETKEELSNETTDNITTAINVKEELPNENTDNLTTAADAKEELSNQNTDNITTAIDAKEELSDKNTDAITTVVDAEAEFPGGIEELHKYIAENYRTPPKAKDLKGKIYVNFIIEKDGSLSDIKILRDLGFSTGKEAARVLKSSPKWNPEVKKGQPIRSTYGFPIIIN